MLYRPTAKLSFGLALSDVGPDIEYPPNLPEETRTSVPLPTTARLGLAWTFFENRSVRLRVMPELTKVLPDMFTDSTGTKTLGRKLGDEWKDVWKAVGAEARAFGLVALRLGYFEDVNSKRGGFMYGDNHRIYQHLGISDILTGSHDGRLRRIGLCWGFGIGYKDFFRIDVSSDAAIYDFETSNWKLTLVANDIAGGIRELKQGRVPWEE
jgi:hypothetical protein